MKVVKQLNYIFNFRQKLQICGLFVLILIGSLFELLGVSAIIPLISAVLYPEKIYNNKYCQQIASWFHIESSTEFIIFFALVLCLLYLIKNLYLIFSKRKQLAFTYGIQKENSLRLMNCYLHQEYLFHVAHNVAELQRNVSSDVNRLFVTISATMNLLVESVTCLFLVILLFIANVSTTLLVVGLLGAAIGIFLIIYKKIQVQLGMRTREAGAKLGKWLIQSFSGIKEIKVMNCEQFFLNNYGEAFEENVKAGKAHDILTVLPKYIIEPLCIGSVLIAMCIRIKQGTQMEEFVTTLSIFAGAAIRMLPSFNRMTEYMSSILYNKVSVDNVFKDLKEAEKLEAKKEYLNVNSDRLNFKNTISVTNLTFVYPNTEKKIFDDASLTIEKNKSVAFVGSSGAGKTTLADIIIGVLEPQKGQVCVDGVDVFTHLDEWHKTIGYIPQTIYLMDDTIRANVVFGLTENEIDDNEVWKALKRAELDEFVKGQPDGLYTQIGDRGVKLSGGQRQRIGIARALYRQPEVLILDEATSALDNETETAVMQSIESLQGSITLIIIAHRLTTIRNCDEVYEVENGRIILKKKK